MHALRVAIALLLCSTVFHVGCGQSTPSEPPIMGAYDDVPAEIKFLDQVEPQAAPMVEFADLPLTSIDGTTSSLKQIANSRPLVVVFTRGYNGAICPYCSTQTARLISNYAEFQKRNAEIVVVYPLSDDPARTHVPEFLTKINSINATRGAAPPPFPLLLDVGLQAVDQLGIRKDLSKPSTYLLDRDGAIRFAYVGKSLADRPSVKVLLEQLDAIASSPTGG